MASDKDHNTPVVLSLKKGKTSQSENSIWNSSIIMVKEKVSHYFGLVKCIAVLSVDLLCELNAKFRVQLVGEIFQTAVHP